MFEKVNPSHPDKVADRIAGAIVDMAYVKSPDPKIAVEVLIGHGQCNIILESSVRIDEDSITNAVRRITEQANIDVFIQDCKQDEHLASNQRDKVRCGDNGIFRGVPTSPEEHMLSSLVKELYDKFPSDGKFIIVSKGGNATPLHILCQSNAEAEDVKYFVNSFYEDYAMDIIVNPLGHWTGGTDVDTGATNRKLGSDMGRAVTGGGLHGKDLSKADVSVNIYAHVRAQQLGEPVELYCAIGDEYVDGLPYSAIVEVARDYIEKVGGFEKFAEWGLL